MSTQSRVLGILCTMREYRAHGWSTADSNRANSSSSLNFTVIVNPGDGPGPNDVPDANYIAAIARLHRFPNVRTLGYVPTDYAKTSIDTVLKNVNTYANWSKNSSNLAVDGIFFDEAPHAYSSDAASYLQQIGNAVRAADGIKREDG